MARAGAQRLSRVATPRYHGRVSRDPAIADAPARNLVDRFAPAGWRPLLRLGRYDRPIGSWLLLWPCWFSAALAAHAAGRSDQLLPHLALFFIGAFVMRGAGSTWNDILDRKIDAQVERTRNRPLASGQVSVPAALAMAAAQALIGLAVLVRFNAFTIGLGCLSLALVGIYPLMKRFFWAPQLVLGLTFSWGALMGWAGAFGALSLPALALYAGAVAWCVGYDTIYGHQDQRDDAVIGVRSTSRLFGSGSPRAIAALYAAAFLLFACALVMAGAGWPSWAGLLAFAGHLGWQLARLDTNDRGRCLALFRSNRDAGFLFFAGLLVDALSA
jgi:4-hydroxybenzoate polyprenyltransferase